MGVGGGVGVLALNSWNKVSMFFLQDRHYIIKSGRMRCLTVSILTKCNIQLFLLISRSRSRWFDKMISHDPIYLLIQEILFGARGGPGSTDRNNLSLTTPLFVSLHCILRFNIIFMVPEGVQHFQGGVGCPTFSRGSKCYFYRHLLNLWFSWGERGSARICACNLWMNIISFVGFPF